MRLTQRTLLRAACALAAVIAFVPATATSSRATTATANLSVTATVVANCSMSTSVVAFGNYDPTSPSPDQAQGAVTVACTKGTPFVSIMLGPGKNLSGGSQRNMNDAASDLLPYSLFKPTGAANTCAYGGSPQSWGDNTAGNPYGSPFVPTGSLTPGPAGVSYPVCGQINAAVSAVPAAYSDTVLATLNF